MGDIGFSFPGVSQCTLEMFCDSVLTGETLPSVEFLSEKKLTCPVIQFYRNGLVKM